MLLQTIIVKRTVGNCFSILALSTATYAPSDQTPPMEVFGPIPIANYESERLKLWSENQALPIRKLLADYVSELDRGNLYLLANSLLYVESLDSKSRNLRQKAASCRDLCLIELAIAKHKVSLGRLKEARVFLDDSIRLFNQQKTPTKDNKYLRAQFRQISKTISAMSASNSEKGELSPAFSKE